MLLLEPGAPGEDLFALADAIRRLKKPVPVVFAADPAPVGWIYRALMAGTAGFLGTGTALKDYLLAIPAVLGSGTYFTPCAARLAAELAAGELSIPVFTEREHEVLRMLCDGRSTRVISQTLALGPKTIDAIRGRLMEKTRTCRATDLVRFACENGYVDPPLKGRSR